MPVGPQRIKYGAEALAAARQVQPIRLQEAVMARRAVAEAAVAVPLPWRRTVKQRSAPCPQPAAHASGAGRVGGEWRHRLKRRLLTVLLLLLLV